jgi:hypothetical protein
LFHTYSRADLESSEKARPVEDSGERRFEKHGRRTTPERAKPSANAMARLRLPVRDPEKTVDAKVIEAYCVELKVNGRQRCEGLWEKCCDC